MGLGTGLLAGSPPPSGYASSFMWGRPPHPRQEVLGYKEWNLGLRPLSSFVAPGDLRQLTDLSKPQVPGMQRTQSHTQAVRVKQMKPVSAWYPAHAQQC